MQKLSVLFSLVMILGSHTAFFVEARGLSEAYEDSVVKIFTTKAAPDYYSPWATSFVESIGGTGSVISDSRILTNAHVVADQKFIQVQAYGEAKKYIAKVEFVSHDADLAILKVDDSVFFAGRKALELRDLPPTRSDVMVYGYPTGGDSLSVTKGILSRVEHQEYVHSGLSFLAGQIDAAINPGNSGGPVVANGGLVGVVMQGAPDLENVGYMVPAPVISQFLNDIQDGEYDSLPDTGFFIQAMSNSDMRRMYKMPPNQTGVLISKIVAGAATAEILQENDILLTINGFTVANDGTIEFRPKERTFYHYSVDGLQVGDEVDIEFSRKGEFHKGRIKLNRTASSYYLTPRRQYDQAPRYYIYGGLVFCPLTYDAMLTVGNDGEWEGYFPGDIVAKVSRWISEEEQEVVLLWSVLPDATNDGYQDLPPLIVTQINGQSFRDFAEFSQLLGNANGEFTVFAVGDGDQLVIDHHKALLSHSAILAKYNIPGTGKR